MSVYPPSAEIVRAREEGAQPQGVDYPDESLGQPISPVEGDSITLAVGDALHVQRPTISYIPWAVTVGVGGVKQPVEFARLYPRKRLLVDIFPSKENLDHAGRNKMLEEVTFKRGLCMEHGYAYVALYANEPIDARVFAQARMEASQAKPVETPSTTVEPPQQSAVELATKDEFTRLINEVTPAAGYHVDAGPQFIPWAWKVIDPKATASWAREALTFSRFYWTVPLAVDLLPHRETVDATVKEQVELKRALCEAHGVPYLVHWGPGYPTVDEIRAALTPKEPDNADSSGESGERGRRNSQRHD